MIGTYDYLEGLVEGLGVRSDCDLGVYDVETGDRGSIEAFKKFVKCFDVVEFSYVDYDFMKKHFEGVGDWDCFTRQPVYDHTRLVKTKDGVNILVLQPYLKQGDCYKTLASWGIKNEYYVSKSLSFHNSGITSLIVIYEDGKTMIG